MVSLSASNPHIPPWILEKAQSKNTRGQLLAATLFVDISGFTPLTSKLMEQGKVGAEALASALRFYFDPPVEAVLSQKGLITGFAGDAFLAVFSEEACEQPAKAALQAALAMQSFVAQNSIYSNEYGTFQFGIKVGLSWGTTNWRLLQLAKERQSFCWQGDAVEGALESESFAERGDVIGSPSFLTKLMQEISGAYELLESFELVVNQQNDQDVLISKDVTNIQVTSSPMESGFAHLTSDLNVEQTGSGVSQDSFHDLSTELLTKLQPFVPLEILEFPWLGEWRNVVAVFLEFSQVDDLDTFGSYVYKKVVEYKGTFTRFDFDDKGNNALLLFGAPTSYEHDLDRALACVWTLLEQADPSWRMRAGVASGFMYAGFNGGLKRHEFACLGRAVPMAVRLMCKAKWGEIWCSDEVQERAPHQHTFQSIGELDLKGFSDPIPSFVYTGQSSLLQGSDGPVVMVGRDRELSQMMTEISALHEGRETNLVYIDGDPGVGKSTLVQATRYQLRNQDTEQSVHWFHAPCDQTLQKSFYPIATAIRSRFLLTHLLPYEEQLSRFHAHLDMLAQSLPAGSLVTAEDIQRVRSVLAALVDLRWEDSLYEKLEPNERLAATHRALVIWLQAEASRSPIVFEIEDAQWADEATKDALQVLWKTLRNERILFLLPCRFHDDGQPFRLDPEGRDVSTLPLKLLDEVSLRELAEEYLKTVVSESLIQLMVQRTEGNPFFAEQVLGYLQDHNGLIMTPEGLAPQEDGIIVPDDVHNVLMARLDRLSLPIRQTVQAASVLGVSFDPRVLSAMLEHEQDFSSRLALAQQEQIWSQMKEFLYLFRHALLRDTAYDMQAPSRLRRLHVLAAESIESLYQGDLTPHFVALAHHFDQAGLVEKAIHYHEKAGQSARDNYHNHAAGQSYARALALLPDTGESTHRVAKLQARTLNVLAQWNLALVHCDIAEKASIAEQSEVACIRASIYVDRKDLEQAEKWSRIAISLAEEEGHMANLAHAWNVLGLVAWSYRKMDDAGDRFRQGLHYYKAANDLRGEAKVLSNLSILSMIRNEHEECEQICEESLGKAKQAHALRVQASCYNNLGNLYLAREQPHQSRHYYEMSLELRREIGDRRGEAMVLGNIGGVDLSIGATEGALAFLTLAQRIYDELGDRDPHVKFHQVEALRLLEKIEDSLTLLEEARLMSEEIQNTEYIAYSRMLRGHLHRTQNQDDEARTAYLEALSVAKDDGLENLVSDVEKALDAINNNEPIPLSVV